MCLNRLLSYAEFFSESVCKVTTKSWNVQAKTKNNFHVFQDCHIELSNQDDYSYSSDLSGKSGYHLSPKESDRTTHSRKLLMKGFGVWEAFVIRPPFRYCTVNPCRISRQKPANKCRSRQNVSARHWQPINPV